MFYLVLSSIFLLCNSYNGMVPDLNKIDNRLSIYIYPNDTEWAPNKFYNGLTKQIVIPKEIIVKIMDIDENKKPLDKYKIFESIYKKFEKEVFDITWMINAYPNLSYNLTDSEKIINLLKSQLNKYTPPKIISLDIEPIINIDTGLNLLPFLAKLISEINSLKLPISVYVNPSCFSNPDGHIENKPGYTDFINALTKNKNNIVYLPAYLGGEDDIREDRITASINTFNKFEIRYKLIIDFENVTKMKERLQFISKNNYSKNGLAIYRLDKSIYEPPVGSMENIKNTLDSSLLLFLKEFD